MAENTLPPNHFWHRDILSNVHHPKDYTDELLYNFEFRESDIILTTYPRSGTLLTQEIIWQIKNRQTIQRNESYGSLTERFPYIDIHIPDIIPISFMNLLDSQPQDKQRFIKTHLPRNAIFDRMKHCGSIVCVYRDAKDVAASLFNFYKSFTDFEDWPPNWEEFFQYFVDGRVMYGSHFKWNSDWLKVKHLPNIHVIKYEDIVKDKAAVIKRLAKFLDEEDITSEQIDIIVENTSFHSMSSKKEVNIQMQSGDPIMRKGIVGDYKRYFTEEQKHLVDSLTEKFIKPFE